MRWSSTRERAPAAGARQSLLTFAALLAGGAASTVWLHGLGGRALWFVPSGIAVAAVIRFGTSQWLPVFAAGAVLELLRGRPPLAAALVAAGLPLGALLVSAILRRAGFDAGFTRRHDPPLFLVATLVGMLVPASVGTPVLHAVYVIDPADGLPWTSLDWLRWWLNDAAGVLLFTPLLVSWRQGSFAALAQWPRLGAAVLLAALATSAAIALAPGSGAHPGLLQLPIVVVALALVVVAALLFGFVPAASIAAGLSLVEAVSYSFGAGVFRGLAPVPGLVSLWSFVGATIGVGSILAMLLAERERLAARLLVEARRNRLFLRSASDGVCILDAAGRVVEASDSFAELTGHERAELVGMHASAWLPAADPESAAAIDGETRYRRSDGRWIDVAVRANEFEADGARYRYLSVRDLTDIRRLESALLDAIGREQRRLGQDIHDGLGQELTLIAMLVDSLTPAVPPALAERAAQLRELTRRAIRTCRGVAHGLSPVEGGDLAGALRQLVDAHAGGIGVQVDLAVTASARLDVRAQKADHLYRIAQEALANAIRHGRAAVVRISVEVTAAQILLEVRDDGVGLSAQPADAGIGLRGMAYRARAIGGQFGIEPAPSGGTRVWCRCANGVVDEAFERQA